MTTAGREPSESGLLVTQPNLAAGIIATIVFVAGLGGMLLLGRARVAARANDLVPQLFTEKWKGETAPLALLQRRDVLPLYGSSELVVSMPNRATEFFATYPTGFGVAPLGDRGYPLLTMTLGIGSLGSALNGKRIAVSLSGTWFLGGANSEGFRVVVRNHYSELQAGDFLFAHGLPIDVRSGVARRILTYDRITHDFPLLNPVLACLASSCVVRGILPALEPIWDARAVVWRAEDAAHVAWDLHQESGARPRRAAAIDWSALESKADSAWRAGSANNPFGFESKAWVAAYRAQLADQRGKLDDSAFVRDMASAVRWEELELLLATLRAVGAHALILNTPLKGMWWDSLGVSAGARRLVYQRFDSVAAKYGFPAVNFDERDGDPMFLSDAGSHPSGKGWLVYDRTLNAFYHGAIP